jgi:hypothetical protein
MKKILLVSGCSFTTDNYQSMYHPNMDTNWPKWPELLANKMDLRIINLGRSGAGNEYIFNSISDALIEYGSQVQYVIAAWSQVQRRDYTTRISNRTNHSSSHFDLKGDIYYFLDRTYRYYFMLQTICDLHKVRFKQFQMIESYRDYIKGIEFSSNDRRVRPDKKITHERALTHIKQNPYYKAIRSENWIGWPGVKGIGGYNIESHITEDRTKKEYMISESDKHPSANGHEKYAEYIYANL